MKNKVLVKVLIPEIDEKYDIFVPINIRIGTLIQLLNNSLTDVTGGLYVKKDNRNIYNMSDASKYSYSSLIRDTDIRNGSMIIFM